MFCAVGGTMRVRWCMGVCGGVCKGILEDICGSLG